MKSKKKIQTRKIQTRKIQTRQMPKLNKKLYTRKNRIYIGGAETTPPKPDFTDKLINRILLLIEELIIKSIDQLGYIIGFDVSNPQQVNAKLEEIKVILTDPEINEKVRIIVGNISVLLFIALEAAQPYIKPMADKINKIYTTSTSDLGKSTITILKNIAKAIPIYGAVVALIDAANTITVTAANTFTAAKHAQSAYADALTAASTNFKEVLSKKKDLLSQISTGAPDLTAEVTPVPQVTPDNPQI